MKKTEIIAKLGLLPLPDEGGYFKQTHKSKDELAVPPAKYNDEKRAASTAIYYLLGRDDFSALHRLKSEEHWSYLGGVSLNLRLIHEDGRYEEVLMGPIAEDNTRQLFTVPAGAWFCASINARNEDDFTLVSCVVAPGFEFADFELGDRGKLTAAFPQQKALIERYTRVDDQHAEKKNSELAGGVFSTDSSAQGASGAPAAQF